ncbi:hypothetical protein [Burkholderia plantarii]|uniref:hypothetical protein n=1 Tax=Burkholderia plantarii TaxID=41899 RepID=UPI0018DCB2EB|nr:hypothetical protein [Burkholderia plantarii]MBI0328313.1 hypothetical protein [Burkholderia plantarii]
MTDPRDRSRNARGGRREGGAWLRHAAVCFLVATIAGVRGFGAHDMPAGTAAAAQIVSVLGFAAGVALFVVGARRRRT